MALGGEVLFNKIRLKVIAYKKDDGSMVDFMYVAVTLLVVAIIAVMVMDWFGNLESKTKLDMIAREYILRMESFGYLDDDDKNSLLESLGEVGVHDISLTGTTTSAVTYGEKIILNVTGNIEITTFQMDGFHLIRGTRDIPVTLYKSSTAKN